MLIEAGASLNAAPSGDKRPAAALARPFGARLACDLTRKRRSTRIGAVSQRKRYLFVCTNRRADGVPKGSCAQRGAVEVHAALKTELAKKGLAKTEARACTSSCTDVCWAGPIIAVEPDGYFYGRVTLADIPEIVEALATGHRVERLVLPPEDFTEATAGPPLVAPLEGGPPPEA
jgi:(2Fe-2S) ferredoxin